MSLLRFTGQHVLLRTVTVRNIPPSLFPEVEKGPHSPLPARSPVTRDPSQGNTEQKTRLGCTETLYPRPHSPTMNGSKGLWSYTRVPGPRGKKEGRPRRHPNKKSCPCPKSRHVLNPRRMRMNPTLSHSDVSSSQGEDRGVHSTCSKTLLRNPWGRHWNSLVPVHRHPLVLGTGGSFLPHTHFSL